MTPLHIYRCILATDMARHNEILNKFKVMQPVFNFSDNDHKEVVNEHPLRLYPLLIYLKMQYVCSFLIYLYVFYST